MTYETYAYKNFQVIKNNNGLEMNNIYSSQRGKNL